MSARKEFTRTQENISGAKYTSPSHLQGSASLSWNCILVPTSRAQLYEHRSTNVFTSQERMKVGMGKQDRQDAFEELKKRLTEVPVLACTDFNESFVLQMDASEIGLGAVLTQTIQGEKRVIASLTGVS